MNLTAMNETTNPSAAGVEQRRRAEQRLRERHPSTGANLTGIETQRLVHELQVHQVELEMQNEELQQARDTVEAAMEKYSDLYDFAPVGYLTLDREGTIQEANLAAAGLLGIDRSRLIKRRLGFSVTPADLPVFNALLRKVFDGQAKEFCEVTLLREELPPVEVRVEAVLAGAGRECRAVLQDMTDHNRIETDRLILNKLESTGILAGGIAHDFNNLLTVILLDLELARTIGRPGQELERLLEEAKDTVLKARSLTQQLITFSDGGAPIRKPMRLAGALEEATRAALRGSRVECQFSLPGHLSDVEADEGQIGQVIRNLVLNAREAMPEGGKLIVSAENTVLGAHKSPPLPPGPYVRVNIIDQGRGIPQEVLPKIFDPYFSTKEMGAQKGMGLGLTICHTVIQKHGGAITVESTVGGGTAFHIYLPAGRDAPATPEPTPAAVPPRRGRILVMDDEEVVRKVIGVSLELAGHEVELAAGGQQAVEAYKKALSLGRPFDAVLLDLTVRGGDGGYWALQRLLPVDPKVKAILMSGYTNDPLMLEPKQHGFKGVLTKPIDSKRLLAVFDNLFGDRDPLMTRS